MLHWQMSSTGFDASAEERCMPSRWGFNLKGDSRIQRYLHLCDVQYKQANRSYSVEYVSYSEDERQGLNIMRSIQPHEDRNAILVFVHGGYWIEGDRHMYNFIANGLHSHGISVVSLGYRLAGKAEDLACCIDDVVAGIQKVQKTFPTSRIYLAGHSAGAHLILNALRKLTTLEGICIVFCVSGIYSLQNIVNTSVGIKLQLDEDQARRFSVPPLDSCYTKANIHIIVGQFDAPEFHKQAQDLASSLQVRRCLPIPVQILPNEDHFSLIENLYFGDSALAQYIAQCDSQWRAAT
ncbi:kynurenine formamidase-like isoform X2 [Varroa jacobsoni]|uniref:kynurenine formamidase-like isoform X2 n=1 Tax=Varroa jacobsoni TaxID=62625 RepID=UPI000BF96819|nr:kynurenine formamidase-like isoform X2 [Varroa jacobsoni]